MSDDDQTALTVEEFVEYCRTQSGLLSGSVETLETEISDLLSEIDEEMSAVRDRLEDKANAVEGTATPQSTERPEGGDPELAAIEELESDLEEKQALIEAKQARMEAFQALATGYADLGEELQSEVDDGQTALERVVQFEAENDAPAYFPETETILEAAAESRDQGAE